MPSFFSWQLETVLFFLAEKEKNGFKKTILWVCWEIGGCNDVLKLLPDPHPSASQTPSPEGKAIRCGGDGRTESSAPTGAAEKRRNGRTESSAPTGAGEDRRNRWTESSAPTGAAETDYLMRTEMSPLTVCSVHGAPEPVRGTSMSPLTELAETVRGMKK